MIGWKSVRYHKTDRKDQVKDWLKIQLMLQYAHVFGGPDELHRTMTIDPFLLSEEHI